MVFKYTTTIRLYDTDAAGLLFFANQFRIAHTAYEAFLEQYSIGFQQLIEDNSFFLPIVHARADFKKALTIGQNVTIEIRLAHLSDHSYTLNYQLLDDNNDIVGNAETVHVVIDARVREKIDLPQKLRDVLLKLDKVKPD